MDATTGDGMASSGNNGGTDFTKSETQCYKQNSQ